MGYLGDIWRCRYFWFSLVMKDLRTRYRRSMLGMGWSLLHPLAMAAIICTVFHKILHVDVWHYGPFVLSGLAFWNYVVVSTSQGCLSFFHGESYIRQHSAPLAIYPLRSTLGATIHFVLALAVIVLVTALLRPDSFSLPALLSLAPTLLLLLLFSWSLAILAAIATAFFQDTQHLCEVGFQIMFYLTPIIYEPKMLEGNRLSWLLQWNPLVPFVGLIREPIVEGRCPALALYALAGGIVAATASAAILALVRFQHRVIFYM